MVAPGLIVDPAALPLGWGATTIGAASLKVGSGSTPTGGYRVYKARGRPFVRSQNVGWGSLILDDVAFIDDATHRRLSGTELRTGDVLLNITGASIGRSVVADARVDGGNVNQHVCIVRLKPGLEPRYVSAFLLSEPGQRQIAALQAGGSRQGLNFQQVRSIALPEPPRDEQTAIALVLEDVAAAERALQARLDKRASIRAALAQRLLRQEVRLIEDAPEWGNVPLGSVCNITIGRTPDRNQPLFWGRGHAWLTIGDLRSKVVVDGGEQITDLGARGIEAIAAGTLLMSFKLTIGRVAFAGRRLYTNEAICALREPSADPEYLYQVLPRLDFSGVGQRAVKGVTLNKESLNALVVPMPSPAEQKAIARVLADADAEIAELEMRLEKTRLIAVGMAQTLLTGRTRLA